MTMKALRAEDEGRMLLEDSPYQIAASSLVLSPEILCKLLAAAANNGDAESRRQINYLVKDGVSRRRMRELYAETEEIVGSATLTPDFKTKRFLWSISLKEDSVPNKKSAIALLVVRIVNAGLVNKLHRCKAEDCLDYFFGDRRAQYCSNTCSSRVRVRKFRK